MAQKGLRHFKLTQMEFDEKYQGNYAPLVAEVAAIIDSRQGKVRGIEHTQRHMLEQLISRRKALKKAQDELDLVQQMYAPKAGSTEVRQAEARERTSGKKDDEDRHSHDNTEVGSGFNQDSIHSQEDEENPEESLFGKRQPKASESNKELDEMFAGLADMISANRYREDLLATINQRAEATCLRFCQLLEGLSRNMKGGLHKKNGLDKIMSLSSELDQAILTLQSKVNLGDFLLNEPANLFIKFGKESLLVGF